MIKQILIEITGILVVALPLVPIILFIEDLLKKTGFRKSLKWFGKTYVIIAGIIGFLILTGIMLIGTSIGFYGIYNTVKDLAIPVRVYHDSHDSSTIDR